MYCVKVTRTKEVTKMGLFRLCTVSYAPIKPGSVIAITNCSLQNYLSASKSKEETPVQNEKLVPSSSHLWTGTRVCECHLLPYNPTHTVKVIRGGPSDFANGRDEGGGSQK